MLFVERAMRWLVRVVQGFCCFYPSIKVHTMRRTRSLLKTAHARQISDLALLAFPQRANAARLTAKADRDDGGVEGNMAGHSRPCKRYVTALVLISRAIQLLNRDRREGDRGPRDKVSFPSHFLAFCLIPLKLTSSIFTTPTQPAWTLQRQPKSCGSPSSSN